MNRALLNKITLALAVVGCAIALVLTYKHFFPTVSIGCSAVGGDCNATIESRYGKLGAIPTSLLGLGMYLTLVGICVLRARSLAGNSAPGPDEKKLGIALFGVSALAFFISWWLQYVSFYVIMSFCPWCFASALTVTAIFLINAFDYLIRGRVLTGEQKMLSGVVVFIGLMLGFLHAPDIFHQIGIVVGPHRHQLAPVDPSTVHPPLVHPREELLADWLVFKGKPTALYTVIEFADYGCGHCREASEDMEKLLKQYPDRYRLAFRNFPLERWPYSMKEAVAAEAAGRQGKFWEMHDALFARQPEVETPQFNDFTIISIGKSIGLDVSRLKKDMESSEIRKRVARDHFIGQINHVTVTPSFFVIPSNPKGKVMLITGGKDATAVFNNPNDPFWSGSQSSLGNPEPSKLP